jgi:hypothetical protein
MICPRCNKSFTGYPAISRRDNTTEICSDCGTLEALNDWYSQPKHCGTQDRDTLAHDCVVNPGGYCTHCGAGRDHS